MSSTTRRSCATFLRFDVLTCKYMRRLFADHEQLRVPEKFPRFVVRRIDAEPLIPREFTQHELDQLLAGAPYDKFWVEIDSEELGAVFADGRIAPVGANKDIKEVEARMGIYLGAERTGDDVPLKDFHEYPSTCLFIGALALLQVKGDVIREDVAAPAKLNKKRLKNGKPAISGYTYVYLDRHPQKASNNAARPESSVAAHLVRGHFKHRKTGTFWWRPHTAGAGEVRSRKAYIVKGDSHA